MRFAISLLTVLAIASIIGTVLKQNEPYNAYLNQLGPFWFPLFEKLGLYSVYHAGWFLLILIFLVGSTSACIVRQSPGMIHEMRSYREKAREARCANLPTRPRCRHSSRSKRPLNDAWLTSPPRVSAAKHTTAATAC
jgi:cytochrome c biogenesis protein ResB